MRDLALIREAARRESRRAVGANVYLSRTHVAQVQESGLEPQLIQLPVDVSGLVQTQDPTTSAFVFMLDHSALGGPDPLG
jgi:hypothetical protein